MTTIGDFANSFLVDKGSTIEIAKSEPREYDYVVDPPWVCPETGWYIVIINTETKEITFTRDYRWDKP